MLMIKENCIFVHSPRALMHSSIEVAPLTPTHRRDLFRPDIVISITNTRQHSTHTTLQHTIHCLFTNYQSTNCEDEVMRREGKTSFGVHRFIIMEL